jgi:NADH-quinone oxidoreductase subunit E
MAEAAPVKIDPAFGRGFVWSKANQAWADTEIAKYPAGKQQSAVMALLDIAQRQIGAETNTQGWLPVPVIEYVADYLQMPYIRVYEVASFYTMYNLVPVGKFHVQVCGTTPCMLRGAEDIIAACKKKGMAKGATTADGLFTLTEVECLGACANAPMVQINDDNYEDLTAESMTAILDDLAAGKQPKIGPQIARQVSCPEGGPTTLKAMETANHDYRGEW